MDWLTTFRERRREARERALARKDALKRAEQTDPMVADVARRLRELKTNDPVRVAVQDLMSQGAVSPEQVDCLIQSVQSVRTRFWKRALAAAWALGRAEIGPSQREGTIRALAVALQTKQWSVNGCSAPLAVGCLFNTLAAAPVLAYLLACDARLNAVRAQAAASLGRIGCLPAMGDLAKATGDANRPGCMKVREAARGALAELVPRLGPEHYGTLPAGTEAALVNMLRAYNPELQLLALEALKHIGGRASLAAVTRVSEQIGADAVSERAREVLPAIRERAARERDAERLLRPAAAPGAPEDVLLRPFEGRPSPETGLLVRPWLGGAECDEEEEAEARTSGESPSEAVAGLAAGSEDRNP